MIDSAAASQSAAPGDLPLGPRGGLPSRAVYTILAPSAVRKYVSVQKRVNIGVNLTRLYLIVQKTVKGLLTHEWGKLFTEPPLEYYSLLVYTKIPYINIQSTYLTIRYYVSCVR